MRSKIRGVCVLLATLALSACAGLSEFMGAAALIGGCAAIDNCDYYDCAETSCNAPFHELPPQGW